MNKSIAELESEVKVAAEAVAACTLEMEFSDNWDHERHARASTIWHERISRLEDARKALKQA
jgi:hypothetical protein